MRSKNLNLPIILGEKLLKAKFGVRITGYVTFFSLTGGEVTGRCSRSLLFVVFSLKLLPSTWMRALVPTEELKDNVICVCVCVCVCVYFFLKNQDPAPRL